MPGPEVIKLEYSLKTKAQRLAVRKQPIVVLYFEVETVLKFYNLEARSASKFISFELLVPGYAKL